MRFRLTLIDIKEISGSAVRAFASTFVYESEESDSDSDLPDYDPDPNTFRCGKITPEVESFVENTWDICDPLDEVYGATASNLIKETAKTATEETQCVGLKLF